jgi:hypothetical protein
VFSPNRAQSELASEYPSNRRHTRAVAAGLALATAGVIAVNPTTPIAPAEVQERAVHLTAFANPIAAWTDTVARLFTNLATQTTDSSQAFSAVASAVTNPTLYGELAEFAVGSVANPTALLDELLNFQSTYGERISAANAASLSALVTSLSRFPIVLTNALNYLAAGEFVETYAELDIYFLVNLLEQPARPLFPLFPIPGDIAAGLPGGERLAVILDTFLTRGGANGIAKALLVAPITASLALAEGLDAARSALQAGDTETAAGALINLPARVVNAFINGYEPNFEVRSTFPGIFGAGGPVDYFLHVLPETIATALTATPAPAITTAAKGSATPGDPAEIALDNPTVQVNVASSTGRKSPAVVDDANIDPIDASKESGIGRSDAGASGTPAPNGATASGGDDIEPAGDIDPADDNNGSEGGGDRNDAAAHGDSGGGTAGSVAADGTGGDDTGGDKSDGGDGKSGGDD